MVGDGEYSRSLREGVRCMAISREGGLQWDTTRGVSHGGR